MVRTIPWTEACEPAQGARDPLYNTLLTLFLSDTVSLFVIVECLFVFPLEALLFLLIPTLVFLVRSFIKNNLDHHKDKEVSRVSVARGHRSSQARCPSAFGGLEVPWLLESCQVY